MAVDDMDFRAKFIQNPRETFKGFGIELPEDVKVGIFENTNKMLNFVIPAHVPERPYAYRHWTNEMFTDLSTIVFREEAPMRYWEEVLMESDEVLNPVS
ncbi:MAG: nitrile hydratase subunit alpha [Nitrospirae bacterium]|nr:nitrile hydratase subunit alpha [Nitrospirota bacterium]MBF0617022.1 nitrile hydratase subunit alpha [Nitrospirota bacterium]